MKPRNINANLNLIYAKTINNVIGINYEKDGIYLLPWTKLKDDMKHFKNLTENNVVIMGRKTFKSLDYKPLPKRQNIVITKNPLQLPVTTADYWNVKDIKKFLLDIDLRYEINENKKKIFVIGGKEIYNLFSEFAKNIYMTTVFVNKPPTKYDVIFNDSQILEHYDLINQQSYVANDRNQFPFIIQKFTRKL